MLRSEPYESRSKRSEFDFVSLSLSGIFPGCVCVVYLPMYIALIHIV